MTTLIIEMAVINVVAFAFALGKAVVRKTTELNYVWIGKAMTLGVMCVDRALGLETACVGRILGLTAGVGRWAHVRGRRAHRRLWLNWRAQYWGVDNVRMHLDVTLRVGAVCAVFVIWIVAGFAAIPLFDPSVGFTAGDALRFGAMALSTIAAFFTLLFGFIYAVGLLLALSRIEWGGVLARLEAYGDGRDLAAFVEA